MFTGIVAAMGTVLERTAGNGGCRLRIAAGGLALDDVQIGDSIAVNGCCLTVTQIEADSFLADVSNETLGCTTLGSIEPGRRVNLEPAMRVGDRLGGHLVSGHVDGVGTLLARRSDGDNLRLTLQHARYAGEIHRPQGQHLRRWRKPDGERGERKRIQREHHPPYPGGNHYRPVSGRAAGQY